MEGREGTGCGIQDLPSPWVSADDQCPEPLMHDQLQGLKPLTDSQRWWECIGEKMMLESGCREKGIRGTGDKNVGYRIPYQWTDRLMEGQAETVAA